MQMLDNNSFFNEIIREKLIFFLLLALIFCLPIFPKVATLLVNVTVMLALVDNVLSNKFKMTLGKPFLLLLAFAGLAALSLKNSPNFAESFYNYKVLMPQYVFSYWLVASYVRTTSEIASSVVAIILSAVCVSLYGLYQYYFGNVLLDYGWVDPELFPMLQNRVFSTLQNPNILASFLVTGISLAVGGILAVQRIGLRILFVVFSVIMTACLILTFSRSAWFALLASLAVASVIYNYRFLFVLLPTTLLIVFFTKDLILLRFMSVFQGNDSSILLRFALWESTRVMIERHFWTGIGWGAYKFLYPEYDFYINNPTIIIYHAHNMYLNIAAEVGVPALLLFVFIMLLHSYFAFTVVKTSEKINQNACALGFVAVQCGVFISGFADYTLFNMELMTLYWITNALMYSLWCCNKENSYKEK